MTSFWLPVECVLCGKPPVQICASCRSTVPVRPRSVIRPDLLPGLAVADYAGAPKQLVHSLKVLGSGPVVRLMALHMAAHLAEQPAGKFEGQHILLVPAPSRKSAIAQRGFVPAALLAKSVARQLRKLGIPAQQIGMLRMNSKVADQTGLNRQQRSQNLAGAMYCKTKPVAAFLNHRLVLVDDVVTTGATLREMNRCLSEAGWQPVSFLTFAETL